MYLNSLSLVVDQILRSKPKHEIRRSLIDNDRRARTRLWKASKRILSHFWLCFTKYEMVLIPPWIRARSRKGERALWGTLWRDCWNWRQSCAQCWRTVLAWRWHVRFRTDSADIKLHLERIEFLASSRIFRKTKKAANLALDWQE